MSRSDAGCALDECIVTDGVRVPAGAAYRRSDSRTRRRRRCARVTLGGLAHDRSTHGRGRRPARPHRSVSPRERPRGTGAARRAAHRRRVGPPLLPDHLGRRTIDRAGAARGTDRLRVAAVRERRASCCSRCRCRCRRSSATRMRSASSRSQDLGDVTLQAHLGAASPAEHAALYRQAVALIELLQRRGAELAIRRDYLPYGIAFDVEKLTWELDFFVRHFLEAYRGVALPAAERAALAEEWAAIAERARRGAARAVPSRLSQPQPDAARRQPVHHRFPGRADGPGHLRSRVAAARFVRRHHRPRARRAHRVFPRAQRRLHRRARNSAAGSI